MATADEIVRVGLQWENIEASLNAAIQQAKSQIDNIKIAPKLDTAAISKIESQLKSISESMSRIKMDSNASKSLTNLVQQLNRVPKVSNFDGLVAQLELVKKAAKAAHNAIDQISQSNTAVQNLGVNGQGVFPAEVKIDFGELESLSSEVAKSVSEITSEVKNLTTALSGVQRITGRKKQDISAVNQETENLKAIEAQEKVIASIEKSRASAAASRAKAEKASNDTYQQSLRQDHLLTDPNDTLSKSNLNDAENKITALQERYSKSSQSFKDSGLSQRLTQLTNDFTELQQKINSLDFANEANVQSAIAEYERLRAEILQISDAMRVASETAKTTQSAQSRQRYDASVNNYDAVKDDAGTSSASKIAAYSKELESLRNQVEAIKNSITDVDNATSQQLDTAAKNIDSITQKIKKLQEDSKYDKSNTKGIFYDLSSSEDLGVKMQSIASGYGTLIDKTVQYSAQARKWSGVVQTQDGQLIQLKASLDQTGTGFRVLTTSMSESQSAAYRVGVSLKDIAKNYLSYFSGQQLMTKLMSQLSEGWQQIQDLDESYTELNKVSDESTATLRAFQAASFDVANQAVTTGKAIQDSAADWMRLGYSIQDASELAKNTSIYANVGEMDISTATEHMISSVKAFNKEFKSDADASAAIADIYNEIDNNFSITAEGIGEGMERAGAALVAANNDIYQSVAMLTAGNEIMQNPELMGNTLKVLSMRIRGAKTELAAAGEETDGMAESTSKLREQIKGLSGVDIMKDANTFKSTYEILDELADKWSSLSDISQASLLETIAGVCPLCAEMYTKFAFNCR